MAAPQKPRWCRRGLHDMNDPQNRYRDEPKCRPCKIERDRDARARNATAHGVYEHQTPAKYLRTTSRWWEPEAACANIPDPDMFFDPDRTRQALAICARCPVRAECYTDHQHEPWGVWGATTPDDRRMGSSIHRPRSKGQPHSAEDRQLVLKMHDQGVRYAAICRETGIPEATVYRWVQNRDKPAKAPPPPRSAPKLEKAMRVVRENPNTPIGKLASMAGVHKQTIFKAKRKLKEEI